MKLPSMERISSGTLEALARFPMPFAAALIGTVAAVIIIGHEGPSQPTILYRMLFGGLLGVPLLTGITLLAERRRWSSVTGWGALLLASLLVVAYTFVIPLDLDGAPGFHFVRFLLLFFSVHMFVAIAPFITKNQVNGFWQFNKALFLRILVSALFAHVVFAGLAFALAALDNLFGMNIPEQRYGQLWALACGLFATTFFLAGVPRNLDELEASNDFPKGLKVFAQYVLLPIVFVYLAILYAYLAKILITWDWPQGWVSKLILGFSGTGILALLLLHPLSRESSNVWIRTLNRWFFVILIPIVVMLFFAIWRRVSEYGITEGRYLAVALGIWLVVMILYFLFFPRKSIKVIPASLCIGTLLITFGPWGVLRVSEQSQVSRLETILKHNAMLVDGKIRKAGTGLPARDTREISAILSYLRDMHGYDAIQPWFDEVLKESAEKPGARYRSAPDVAAIMGLHYIQPRRVVGRIVVVTANQAESRVIKGFDYLLGSRRIDGNEPVKEVRSGSIAYRSSANLDTLTVVRYKDTMRIDSVRIDIGSFLRAIVRDREGGSTEDLPPALMSLSASSGKLRVMVCISDARAERADQDLKLLWYRADFLYAVEEEPL